jgi:hypothetical protein
VYPVLVDEGDLLVRILVREASSSGRTPASSERSAVRALRFDDRTALYVARARTNVPPAVANEEIVAQSAMTTR